MDLDQLQQQLGAAADFVMDDIRQKWKEISGGPSMTDGLKAFAAAVDWRVRRRRAPPPALPHKQAHARMAVNSHSVPPNAPAGAVDHRAAGCASAAAPLRAHLPPPQLGAGRRLLYRQ